ncbi:CAP domain-containing protein [uncultured Paracoccus sp.]|uniref:CAP domain-containing protein n=1 Tax=uncultured Paracoccus sp. TaxID=189685 RepID=UPI0025F5D15F|nr:CAP domain-containing protein [uncultured Paracoccus sp.]
MLKLKSLAFTSLLALAACQPIGPHQIGPDGQPGGSGLGGREAAQVHDRMLEQINQLRSNIGASPMVRNTQLDSAASAHARDMAAQNRAWHFGSDGTSPLDRVRRAGFMGTLIGENISETYEKDIETLNAWMQTRQTRDIIMDTRASQLGVGWFEESGGKLWWVLITGS